MKQFHIKSGQIQQFISHLMETNTVYAPHKKGNASYTFDTVISENNVVLDYDRTLSSIKKYFLPQREVLLNYNITNGDCSTPKIEPVDAVFLGVHNYDLQAVLKLDHNFSEGNPESNYLTRRKNATFIGITYTPDKHHFAKSLGIPPHKSDGFDLFMHKNDGGYIIEIITEKGDALINGFNYKSEFNGDIIDSSHFETKIYANQDKLSRVFSDCWDSHVWDEFAEKCVGCGTCNLVCPTCYCFNVVENVDLTLTEGNRERHLDGCMLRSFTEVAGGEIFRNKLSARMRHRIFRKFKYISDKTGEPWCVGCGRCTAFCTAGISIVEIVNKLIGEYDNKKLSPQLDADYSSAWD